MPSSVRRKLRSPALAKVAIRDAFWAPRIEVNRTETVPIEFEQCRKTGRIDAWKLDWREGMQPEPHPFWDSDVAKWIEAAACSLATHPDARLERRVDRVIDLIAKAQRPDGYLNTYFSVVAPEKRWANLGMWHELYCAGHLIEAAVAYWEATGKSRFLDVVRRYADAIDAEFGPGKRRGCPGHQEIELALVKLYRATGERRYLELALFFLNQRGQQPSVFREELERLDPEDARLNRHFFGEGEAFHTEYCQDHLPVREQGQALGHAVRAMYLYCAMADVAGETGDQELRRACLRLWNSVCDRRMYVTGGIGSSLRNEGFTHDYDLPNLSAYAETCAAVGLVFWSHRMLELECDGRFADVMERALYNGAISGVSLDGRRFFYVNPLASHGDVARREWFDCACCPPNIARLLASLRPLRVLADQEGSLGASLHPGPRRARCRRAQGHDRAEDGVPVEAEGEPPDPAAGADEVCALPADSRLVSRTPGDAPRPTAAPRTAHAQGLCPNRARLEAQRSAGALPADARRAHRGQPGRRRRRRASGPAARTVGLLRRGGRQRLAPGRPDPAARRQARREVRRRASRRRDDDQRPSQARSIVPAGRTLSTAPLTSRRRPCASRPFPTASGTTARPARCGSGSARTENRSTPCSRRRPS